MSVPPVFVEEEKKVQLPISDEKKKNKKILEDHQYLDINELKIDKQIGAGGSARVYKGYYRDLDVAIKRLSLNCFDVSKIKQEFKREVNTLSKIDHPNLVQFMGVAMNQKDCCIVTEF